MNPNKWLISTEHASFKRQISALMETYVVWMDAFVEGSGL